jgi:outer membrane protein TolC
VLSAEKSVKDTSDALLALIDRFELDTTLGDAKFEDFTGQLPVIESSYQLALHHQPDYISAKMQLDQFQLDLGVAKNALKPTVNVDGILGFNGMRGSAYDAFNSAVNRDGNSWEVDLTMSYPWGRVSDKARYRQSLSILSQQTLVVRQLEQNILVQVRSAVRAVETNSEKVKIAALAAEFSAKEYDLENARFSAGLATSRDVLQTQSDLENARIAELQAPEFHFGPTPAGRQLARPVSPHGARVGRAMGAPWKSAGRSSSPAGQTGCGGSCVRNQVSCFLTSARVFLPIAAARSSSRIRPSRQAIVSR